MTNTQEKIKQTSRYISIALKIVQIFLIVGAAASAVGLGILCFRRGELAALLVDVGKFPNAEVASVLMPLLIGVLAASMAVDALGCNQLYRIFKDISREAAPFARKHVRRIKTVAWLCLPMTFLDGTIPNLQSALEAGDRMIGIGVELMWPVFGAIIYCFALIFDYGCQLQQESDETL